jgi:hypothetical protein
MDEQFTYEKWVTPNLHIAAVFGRQLTAAEVEKYHQGTPIQHVAPDALLGYYENGAAVTVSDSADAVP